MTIRDRVEGAVDWTLGLVSPLRRAQGQHFARMREDPEYRETILAMMRARGYRAAGTGSSTPFTGSNQSADAEILPSINEMQSRGRELTRDDPIGSGLRGSFTSNVIGWQMRPQARLEDEEKNRKLEAYWEARKNHLAPADDMTQGEWQRMVFGCAWETGNLFVKATKADAGEHVWFETIEKDRVATPTSRQKENIVAGVRKDAFNRPVSYFVQRAKTTGIGSSAFEEVPAERMIHLRLADRPGQTLGVPACHAILQDIRDLDLLILASLKRVQIAACLSVFIKTQKSLGGILDLTAQKYGYKLDQALEPGMLFRLYPEEEVQMISPNFPSSEFGPFVVLLARRIGAALGVSWQIVLKDFSESTYSSARTDLLEARQIYSIFQRWFIDKFLNRVWREVMLDGILMGELPGITAEDIVAVYWIPPGWQWIDPASEAAASEIELRLGITTLQEICAKLGKDWEETLRQRLREEKREQEMRAEMGMEPKRVEDDTAIRALVKDILALRSKTEEPKRKVA